ncbi:MAG: hypothetical protein RIR48_357 [Bacteroidota bacterium]|jgi:hypothetical protein
MDFVYRISLPTVIHFQTLITQSKSIDLFICFFLKLFYGVPWITNIRTTIITKQIH